MFPTLWSRGPALREGGEEVLGAASELYRQLGVAIRKRAGTFPSKHEQGSGSESSRPQGS